MASVLAAVSLTIGVGEAFAGVPTTAAIAPAVTTSAEGSPAQPVYWRHYGWRGYGWHGGYGGIAAGAGVPAMPGAPGGLWRMLALACDPVGTASRVGLLIVFTGLK